MERKVLDVRGTSFERKKLSCVESRIPRNVDQRCYKTVDYASERSLSEQQVHLSAFLYTKKNLETLMQGKKEFFVSNDTSFREVTSERYMYLG